MIFSLIGFLVQAAETISHQGFLWDADGMPLASGQYNMEISLFNVESAGSALNGTHLTAKDLGSGSLMTILVYNLLEHLRLVPCGFGVRLTNDYSCI